MPRAVFSSMLGASIRHRLRLNQLPTSLFKCIGAVRFRDGTGAVQAVSASTTRHGEFAQSISDATSIMARFKEKTELEDRLLESIPLCSTYHKGRRTRPYGCCANLVPETIWACASRCIDEMVNKYLRCPLGILQNMWASRHVNMA